MKKIIHKSKTTGRAVIVAAYLSAKEVAQFLNEFADCFTGELEVMAMDKKELFNHKIN
jgi:hypothetical protein